MSASQSSGSPACLELPLRKPLDEDSLTPLKWSTSMSTSLLGGDAGTGWDIRDTSPEDGR